MILVPAPPPPTTTFSQKSFFREFTTLSVLLSRIKGGKFQILLWQLPFNSLMRWNGVTAACDLALMNPMHYCGISFTHRREDTMTNSYSGEDVEQAETDSNTPHGLLRDPHGLWLCHMQWGL